MAAVAAVTVAAAAVAAAVAAAEAAEMVAMAPLAAAATAGATAAAAGARPLLAVLTPDCIAAIGSLLLKTDPKAACALRRTSKQMRDNVDSGAQAVLSRAEGHLWECLNAKTIVALKAAADAIAVDGVDALKLLRRAHKKNVEEDDPEEVAPWNAIDFGAVRSISS